MPQTLSPAQSATQTLALTCTVTGDLSTGLTYTYTSTSTLLLNAKGDIDFSGIDGDIAVTINLVTSNLTPAGSTLQFDTKKEKDNFWIREGSSCPDANNNQNSIFHNFNCNDSGNQLTFKDNNPKTPRSGAQGTTYSYALRVKDQNGNWYMNDPTIKNR